MCSCSPEIEIERDGANLREGNTTSCGCYRVEFRRLKEGEASRNRLYRRYKSQAKLDFKLTMEEAETLFKGICYYCGQSPNQISYAENMFGKYIYNGIDRRDNKVGYI